MTKPLQIDIVTGLPEILDSFLSSSMIGIAREKERVHINVHSLREYTTDKHRRIDDYPYGGGSGMVLKPEPLFACLEHLGLGQSKDCPEGTEVIFMTPDGERLDQPMVNQLSLQSRLVLIAGHYKGIDQRVRDYFVTKEISIGDYVLSGGELAAAVIVDAVARLQPGVLGDATSALSDSFQDSLLDAPVYTRPSEFRGQKVPEVLLSGDHDRIDRWHESQRLQKTRNRRPDLLDQKI